MDHRRLIVSILFVLIIGILENVNGYAGYKWVSLKSGEAIPKNAVLINTGGKYIGRARHFDEILPAEIAANGSAFISSCHKEIFKDKFEVLITPDACKWKSFTNIKDIDENIVRVGTAWNGEPIYLGVSMCDNSDKFHITSIYLTKGELYNWFSTANFYRSEQLHYLSCKTKTKWIDSPTFELPNNTVSGGKSEEGYDIYVAQLKRGCDVVTGQVIPELVTATAFLNDGSGIEAGYCEVLVGEPNEYTWIAATSGIIPDYAVANGKYGNEVAYVARVNKTIGRLTHSQAFREELDYDVLVTNVS